MFTSKEFFLALEDLEVQKGIKKEVFLEALTNAIAIAYRRDMGESRAVEVRITPETNRIRVFAYQTVVEEVEDKDKEISLEDARLKDRKYKVGDRVQEEVKPKDFGRIAAQSAREVVKQKLREEESELVLRELGEKEDKLFVGTVRRRMGNNVFIEVNKIEAMLGEKDQMPNDKLNVGDRVKVYIRKIKMGLRGPQISATRTNANFVRRLFEVEVPEIEEGIVEIKNIVREPGYRTKMSVISHDANVDPVGACVGNSGRRVSNIVAELDNEKIDIIPWDEDPLEFVARALSPAKVLIVQANEEEKYAKAIVADDQLSLAIGKDGQNARLAARLTGWRIDVKPQSKIDEDDPLTREQAAVTKIKKMTEKTKEKEKTEVEKPDAENLESVFDEDL